MAPPRKSRPHSPHNAAANPMRSARKKLAQFTRQYCTVAFAKSLLCDPARLGLVSWAILLAELVLNVLVVQRVRYTEIDWRAYMQQSEGFLNGTRNYAELRGDTGPLVYPAGFLYIYTALYFITSHGTNIRLAQYIFVGIYLLQMFLVLRLYRRTLKVPPYVLLITTFTSYRIHSIYVLRLFNDPVAIVLLYAALNCYVSQRWTWGSVLLSLGVAVKMNVLLFAPAILLLYLTSLGVWRTAAQLSICGGLQLLLGAPFLLANPWQYLRGSFDLGRVFEWKWTVNFRFVQREWFEWSGFHGALLALHAVLLLVFLRPALTYMRSYARLRQVQRKFQVQIDAQNALGATGQSEAAAAAAAAEAEQLTEEQRSFLQSFERTLRSSSGAAAAAARKPETSKQLHQQQTEQYTLNCERTVQLILLPLFLANFIGIVCARSLHYQFYVWYFHSLPYLVWCTGYSISLRFLLLGAIEFAWNTYPSTVHSSLTLHAAHAVLLIGVARQLCWRNPVPVVADEEPEKEAVKTE